MNVVGEFKPKRTAAASCGFLAIARLSCRQEDCCIAKVPTTNDSDTTITTCKAAIRNKLPLMLNITKLEHTAVILFGVSEVSFNELWL